MVPDSVPPIPLNFSPLPLSWDSIIVKSGTPRVPLLGIQSLLCRKQCSFVQSTLSLCTSVFLSVKCSRCLAQQVLVVTVLLISHFARDCAHVSGTKTSHSPCLKEHDLDLTACSRQQRADSGAQEACLIDFSSLGII